MITNAPIDLSDEQRCRLANFLDNKITKRLATRAEIKTLCFELIKGIVSEQLPYDIEVIEPAAEIGSSRVNPLAIVDPEDEAHLKGKSIGFIFGYNKVKKGPLKQVL